MRGPLSSGFPLGRSRRLPLVAWCFPFPWSRFTEDRVVLGNISWQSGLSLFILRHSFLLGIGRGLDVKRVRVTKPFGPTIAPQNPAVWLLGRGGGFWCSRAYIMADQVSFPMGIRASSPAQGTLLAFRCTRCAVINTFMGWCRLLRYTGCAFNGAFMRQN